MTFVAVSVSEDVKLVIVELLTVEISVVVDDGIDETSPVVDKPELDVEINVALIPVLPSVLVMGKTSDVIMIEVEAAPLDELLIPKELVIFRVEIEVV